MCQKNTTVGSMAVT